jgi:hypothetical protein
MPLPKPEETKLGHHHNSLQIPTNTEDHLFPQPIGPTTPLDFCLLQKHLHKKSALIRSNPFLSVLSLSHEAAQIS